MHSVVQRWRLLLLLAVLVLGVIPITMRRANAYDGRKSRVIFTVCHGQGARR